MKRLTALVLILFAILLKVSPVHAQTIPQSIVIQGVLRDQQNNAVTDGVYELKFSVYTQKTGGVAVWMSPAMQVKVQNGSFQAKLTGYESNLNFNTQYYVGVTISGTQEFSERIALSAAPYTMRLVGSENVLGGTGNVGIGTTTPDEKLVVDGNVKVAGNIELGTGLLANTALRFNNPDAGIYNEFYRPIIKTSVDETSSGTLQLFTGAEGGNSLLELNTTGGVELSPDVTLRLRSNSWNRGLRFATNQEGASSSENFFISRGASSSKKDHIVFHIDSTSGSKFEIRNNASEVILSVDGSSGNAAIGKSVNADSKLDVDGPIYVKGTKMFDLVEYSFISSQDIETGYDATKWTAMIAGRKGINWHIYRGTVEWRAYCYQSNGTIKIRYWVPLTNGNSQNRVQVLFIKKEMVTNSNYTQ